MRQLIVTATLVAPISAQTLSRTATMQGGGYTGEGKCVIEVVVDGAAQVEITGNKAVLRDVTEQTPQWRRFECTAAMPSNPANFEFQGIDGRGSQSLVRDPRNGGTAVIRIDDPQGGSEAYTFQILWSANNTSQNLGGYSQNSYSQNSGDYSQTRGEYPQNAPEYPENRRDYRDQAPLGPRAGDRDYSAQTSNRDWDRWHQERRGFGEQQWRGRIFERVREDLDHIDAEAFSGRGDVYRLGQARRELDEMQEKLANSQYDERELDDVIATVGAVVRDNRMSPRDRDVLSDDLRRLNDFRERHDYYGAR